MTKTDDELRQAIRSGVGSALDEDLGAGDLTAGLLPEASSATAAIVSREPMTLAGRPWVDEVYRQIDPGVHIDWRAVDGDRIDAGAVVCELHGRTRSLLSGERVALNYLQTLSATATTTTACVDAVAGIGAKVLDTRKTIPGLRLAQKYAVRCGGGFNHRLGLHDAILIKENHVVAAGGIAAAIEAARDLHRDLPVEIEVESIDELREALAAHADRILLDNFELPQMARAVEVNRSEGEPPAELEASGGLTIESLREVAATGVDYISVGALTKDVRAIDLSMRFSSTR